MHYILHYIKLCIVSLKASTAKSKAYYLYSLEQSLLRFTDTVEMTTNRGFEHIIENVLETCVSCKVSD